MATHPVPTVEPALPPSEAALNTESAEQSALAAWRDERRTFVGGSEIYELLSIPQYGKGCVKALAYKKLGVPPDFPDEGDPDLFERGHELEPLAAQKYERETGRKVRSNPVDKFGLPKVRRHATYAWAGVHTDRTILAGHGGVKDTGDLELKTHRAGPFLHLLRAGVQPGHLLQVQHSLLVTGHKWGAFAVLWPDGWKMKHFDVERDESTIGIIEQAGDKFWSLITSNSMPDPLPDKDDQRCRVCAYRSDCRGEAADQEEFARLQAQKAGKAALVQISNPALEQLIADRQLLHAEIAEAEVLKKEKDLSIKELVAAAQLAAAGSSDGAITANAKVYKKPMTVPYLDEKALKQEQPEVYKKFTRTREAEYYRIYDL